MLDRRVQVLVDEERWRRLEAEARRRRVSVGQVIRDAIDTALPSDVARKRSALRRILAVRPVPVPEDPAELRRELDEARGRDL